MKNKHIGLNFDDFLKEECIEFEEQEFKKGINIPSRQIIINGVDVNGCYYYADGKCTNSQMTQWNCKNVAVCYYKEYKRKEQKCEELKEKLTKSIFENGEKQIALDVAIYERDKYSKTLIEIKEVVGIGLVDGLQSEEYSIYLKILQAQILQKISEVLDD